MQEPLKVVGKHWAGVHYKLERSSIRTSRCYDSFSGDCLKKQKKNPSAMHLGTGLICTERNLDKQCDGIAKVRLRT